MKFSTRARYGLRICFLLSISDKLSLTALAERTSLSRKYLEQIVSMLKKAGIVLAERGAEGGYALSRSPAEISVKQILEAVEDSFEITDCVSGECNDMYCPNRKIFAKLYADMNKILANTTLEDMIDDYKCI